MPKPFQKMRRPNNQGSVLWSINVGLDIDGWMREYARANNLALAYAADIAFRTLQAQVEAQIAEKTEAEAKEPKLGAPKFSGNADETTVAL